MKTEDFERLKNLIDSQGWDVIDTSTNTSFSFEVQKKDIWDGVEFAQYVGLHNNKTAIFKINEVSYVKETGITFFMINNGQIRKDNCKPSTEQAYIDELKKIAFDKFGEIKDGDRFKRDFDITINEICTIGECQNTFEFKYFKSNDSLEFCGSIIYQQGKWAEKLTERVKVEFDKLDTVLFDDENESKFYMNFRFSVSHMYFTDNNKIGKLLAKQLETYLNDTNNNKD